MLVSKKKKSKKKKWIKVWTDTSPKKIYIWQINIIKRCSISSVSGEVTTKTTVRYHLAVVQLLDCVWLSVNPDLQCTRLLCPPLSPRIYSNSCPLSWWWYLTTSSSTAIFSFCLHSSQYQGYHNTFIIIFKSQNW